MIAIAEEDNKQENVTDVSKEISGEGRKKQNTEGITHLGSKNTKYVYDYDPSLLERFERKIPEHQEDDTVVNLDCFEFVSKCPVTGQPDLATIHISYIPDKFCAESKSLKLYLFSFQQHGDFHESCVATIRDDLVNLLHPKYLEVYGDFNSRGGISILPFAVYADGNHQDMKKARQLAVMQYNLSHKPRTS